MYMYRTLYCVADSRENNLWAPLLLNLECGYSYREEGDKRSLERRHVAAPGISIPVVEQVVA